MRDSNDLNDLNDATYRCEAVNLIESQHAHYKFPQAF